MAAVPAARSVLRVVKYLAEQTGPVQAAALARDLGIPRSSAYQLLGALQDEGFLVHFPEEHAYALSNLLGELGTSADHAARLQRLGTPLLKKLIARVQLPVVAQLGILHGTDVVYTAKQSADRAPSTVSAIGVRLPAHLTATGRAMLAALDHAQVRALFPTKDSLTTRGGGGPRSLRELDEVLRATRVRGWAHEREEITPDYDSVAAVVLDHNDHPAAAVALTYRAVAVDASLVPSLGAAVQETAGVLSARIRGRG
jgi:DNA-binding IclR family transcriptional regulator